MPQSQLPHRQRQPHHLRWPHCLQPQRLCSPQPLLPQPLLNQMPPRRPLPQIQLPSPHWKPQQLQCLPLLLPLLRQLFRLYRPHHRQDLMTLWPLRALRPQLRHRQLCPPLFQPLRRLLQFLRPRFHRLCQR